LVETKNPYLFKLRYLSSILINCKSIFYSLFCVYGVKLLLFITQYTIFNNNNNLHKNEVEVERTYIEAGELGVDMSK